MSRSVLAQLEKREKEHSLREKSFQEEINILTIEITENKKSLSLTEKLLNEKEIDLERALGGFNEKGEELNILTAQVLISVNFYYYRRDE